MSRITIDAALSQALGNFSKPVELCDPSGRVVGRFVPTVDLSEWEPVHANEPEVADEQLQHRLKNETRYTTAQVLAHLEKL